MSIAVRKGPSALAAEAVEHRIILTSHGRPVAVVDSAERLEEDLRAVRTATGAVIESCADAALGRAPAKFALAEVCARVGISVEAVHKRAQELKQR